MARKTFSIRNRLIRVAHKVVKSRAFYLVKGDTVIYDPPDKELLELIWLKAPNQRVESLLFARIVGRELKLLINRSFALLAGIKGPVFANIMSLKMRSDVLCAFSNIHM